MPKAKSKRPVKKSVPVKQNPHRVANAVRELVRTTEKLHEKLSAALRQVADTTVERDDLIGICRETHDAGLFPTLQRAHASGEVPLAGYFNDFRGSIKRLSDKSVGSVQVITSYAGTRRASHWHRVDSHLCYVVSGEIEYLERPVGSTEAPTSQVFTEGHQFFTRPGVEHEMLFHKDTIFVVLANRHRTPEEYEADLVRLEMPLKRMPGEGEGPAAA